MQPPVSPPEESGRIAVLHSLNILDTPSEERFDRLTRIAKRIFSVPIAMVTLIDTDRQWIKSRTGIEVQQTSRDVSFCGHTILGDEIFHVPDAQSDERFFDNPLVTGDPNLRFYAGCPLRVANQKVGSLCLIDKSPRAFSDEERFLLADLARMVEAEMAAERLAATDQLTGLANRRGFEIVARQIVEVCRRLHKPASLVFFDLNNFKPINDRMGHGEGDRALQIFAEALAQIFRESDVVARVGGDEFAVLLTDTTQGAAHAAISRLRDFLAVQMQATGRPYEINFSAGVVEFDARRHLALDDLLQDADRAMYREKAAQPKN